MNVTGAVYSISEPEIINEKIKKQVLILKTDESFPQFLKMETINDKCEILSELKNDDFISVDFNLRGKIASNGNCYNSLVIFRAEKI